LSQSHNAIDTSHLMCYNYIVANQMKGQGLTARHDAMK